MVGLGGPRRGSYYVLLGAGLDASSSGFNYFIVPKDEGCAKLTTPGACVSLRASSGS